MANKHFLMVPVLSKISKGLRETRQLSKNQSTKHHNLNNFDTELQPYKVLKSSKNLGKLNISIIDTVRTRLLNVATGRIFLMQSCPICYWWNKNGSQFTKCSF